jgi:hypothetical protein
MVYSVLPACTALHSLPNHPDFHRYLNWFENRYVHSIHSHFNTLYMKTSNQRKENDQEPTEQVNWVVVGPILAVLIGAIIWTMFF